MAADPATAPCCTPVCEHCGSSRVPLEACVIDDAAIEDAARRLELAGWRRDLTAEQAAGELAEAFVLLFEHAAPRLHIAAERVLERAQWNTRGRRGLIPGLEPPARAASC